VGLTFNYNEEKRGDGMKEQLFFDLDGTIIDSSEGIYSSIRYALEKLNHEPISDARLQSFIGPPLIDSFRELGFTEETAQLAVTYYRENYRDKGLFQVRPYDKIQDTLAELSNTHELFIATSKPEIFAQEILTHLGFAKFFKGIYGADLENKRGDKASVLAYALKEAGASKGRMIGDRSHDILGAKENGLPAIGVLYGFGSEEELLSAGAIALVKEPIELVELLKEKE
jgi:phosphoglycolate phosphatase